MSINRRSKNITEGVARAPNRSMYYGMSMGQWLCVPMIVGGAALWVWCGRSAATAGGKA